MHRDPEPTTLSEGERRILAMIEAELDLGTPDSRQGTEGDSKTEAARRALRRRGRRGRWPAHGGDVHDFAVPRRGRGRSHGDRWRGRGVPVETVTRRMTGFLGWWVDPNGADRGPGLRDDAR